MKHITPLVTIFVLFGTINMITAQSTLVTVAEDPGQVTSSLMGTNVYDFNELGQGVSRNVSWENVGSFDQLNIKTANQWGGAADAENPSGTQYSVQGVGSIESTTLTLNTPSSYFGMYWSAGDASNRLSFYNSGSLIAEFTTATLLSNLPAEYYGNPIDKTLASHEPFAFINFYGDEFTSWDTIVFNNVSRSGFESDNYTTRVQALNPDVEEGVVGNVVAEVSGTTTTEIEAVPEEWTWSSNPNVPGAPAPPLVILLGFAGLILVRDRFKKRVA